MASLTKGIGALALSVLITTGALAQAQTSLFRYNTLIYNPAYTGMAGELALGINGQASYLLQDYRQVEAIISADAPVQALHGGIGVLANGYHSWWGDSRSKYRKLGLGLVYSYHLQLAETLKLGIGVQTSVNKSFLTYNIYNSNVKHPLYAEADLGLWLQGEKFFAGVSAQNLLRQTSTKYSDFLDLKNQSFTNPLVGNLTAGYFARLSEKVTLSPVVLYQVNRNNGIQYTNGNFERGIATHHSVLVNNTVILKDKYHLGATLQLYGSNPNNFSERAINLGEIGLNAGFTFANANQFMVGYDGYLLEARLFLRL